jgi:hypothetical protein
MENVRFTTPTQQVHNNLLHEGEPHTLESTSCEKLLCTYYKNIVHESNSF